MAVVEELIRAEDNGSISFGNYLLNAKTKVQDFEFGGDLYKVKTFKEITKLERNGLFVYESVPGTAVNNFAATEKGLDFFVEGLEDTQITVELEEDANYKIFIDDINIGQMKTNLSGKMVLSVEFNCGNNTHVKVVKL